MIRIFKNKYVIAIEKREMQSVHRLEDYSISTSLNV